MRTVVLVDGEHYPPVTRWGIETAVARGHDVVGALFVGGIEKIDPGSLPDVGVPTRAAGSDRMAGLASAIDAWGPDVVLDLSDEPILGYRERMELAAVALIRGVRYEGSDFRLEPPEQGPPLASPTLAVIGTGKRTGKTAISGQLARLAASRGEDPVVVAMGRGGPGEPQVAEAGTVHLDRLVELVRRGEHAASDYLEDALTTGVTTIGARRAGGGLAGAPYASNLREAAEMASARSPGLVLLEGSGSAVPPVPWDAGVLVVPSTVPPEYLGGYLGPYRLLRSDLVVVTMAAGPVTGPENLSALRSHLLRFVDESQLLITDFVPVPLADVRDARVFFATTAPGGVAARQVEHLREASRCEVVGWSARLADRVGLAEDLDAAQGYDVLLTELKAAAVDVGVERAHARGAEVVFVDNRAVVAEGSTDLDTALGEVIDLAGQRGARRGASP
ncbi:MAG TPA: cyclic 2,3-diphosphoglycerate synthetase [Actinomycetota bacterium]|nr:cyclic 2,3-diphosphoglycerate synthetase [Actinomycetota bacterium]